MLSRFAGFMISQVSTELTASPLPQQTPPTSIFPDGGMLGLHHTLLALPTRRLPARPGEWEAEAVALSFLLPPAFPYVENGEIRYPLAQVGRLSHGNCSGI